ncbi:hypothetical protein Trydic_g9002 [Trypoxylus dichotomus]
MQKRIKMHMSTRKKKFVITSVLVSAPFIRKCSRSDPNLIQCAVTNANLAIPTLVKEGVPSLDIPVLSPLLIRELELPGTTFTVLLTNVRLEGLENFRLTRGEVSLEIKDQRLLFEIPLLRIAADYKIITSGVFARSIQGGGKLELSLDQNSGILDVGLAAYQKNGDLHFKYEGWKLGWETQRILYNFSDLYTSDTVDFPEFLNKHKEIVDYRIKPAVQKLLLRYLKLVLNNLVEKVPARGIFDL